MGNARESKGKILNHIKKKHKNTRRGYSKRQTKKRNKIIKFSILGCNANGLNGKQDSLQNAISHFDNPSCITIQETKLKRNNFKIPGYQIFLRNRDGLGGGLLTAIESNLFPVMISSPQTEILVVQVKIGQLDVGIINGYGPQEDDSTTSIHSFW